MGNKIFAYVRRNIKQDSIEEQTKLINNYCAENKISIDERDFVVDSSENTLNRDGYNALCSYMMRSGDVLVVTELDRLGKDIATINDELAKLNGEGIYIIVIKNQELNTFGKDKAEIEAQNKIMFGLLNYLSEKERAKNKRKQLEGIKSLKEKNNGKGIGRPKTKISREFKEQYKLWKSNKQTAVQTFNNLGLTKATFYRMVKEYESDKS